TGDAVTAEVLTGHRRSASIRVTSVVQDFLGASAYMTLDALSDLSGDGERVSGAYLLTRPAGREAVSRSLTDAPAVASVVSPGAMLASFESQLEGSLYVSIGFMVLFSSIISVAVIYNGTRIALSERGRELASLRVLGFTRAEVARLLLGEQAVVTVLAIPIGCALGYGLAFAVLAGLASETYRVPLVVGPGTYAWAAGVTLVAAGPSAWLGRRLLDRLDLIAGLHTRA